VRDWPASAYNVSAIGNSAATKNSRLALRSKRQTTVGHSGLIINNVIHNAVLQPVLSDHQLSAKKISLFYFEGVFTFSTKTAPNYGNKYYCTMGPERGAQ